MRKKQDDYKGLIIETYINTDDAFKDSYKAARDLMLFGIIKSAKR